MASVASPPLHPGAELHPAVSFAEDRYNSVMEIMDALQQCPEECFARLAGKLVLRLAIPGPTEKIDQVRRAGLFCLAGHIYDISRPELFANDPPVEIGRGLRYRTGEPYPEAVLRGYTFVQSMNFYLDSGMSRWRRFRDQ
jgi:hypothetical protein